MDFLALLHSSQADFEEAMEENAGLNSDSRPWFVERLGFDDVDQLEAATESLAISMAWAMMKGGVKPLMMVAIILDIGQKMERIRAMEDNYKKGD